MGEVLFCIAGPSGVGKGTLMRMLIAEDPTLALSVSYTTREPRAGERDGVDYHFVSIEEFLRLREEGFFLESDKHFKNYYGTSEKFVREQIACNRSVLLEIDVVGSLAVAEHYRGLGIPVVLIMVLPPSIEELEARLRARGSESDEQIKLRRERIEYEYGMQDKFDYIVVNDDLGRAKEELRAIINQEINKR